MKNWSPWIPYPRSWVNAVFLVLISGLLLNGAERISRIGYYLTSHLPRLDALFCIFTALSPILFIAVIHHFLNLVLDTLLPNNELLELDKVQGLNPGLISWWKGLYSWLVIVLATMLSIGVLDVFLVPLGSTRYFYSDDHTFIISAIAITWIVFAAYFYHFEHLVKQSIVANAKKS